MKFIAAIYAMPTGQEEVISRAAILKKNKKTPI